MRHKVIEVRQEVFNHNEHEVSKRWAFEEGVCFCFLQLMFEKRCSVSPIIDLLNYLTPVRSRDHTSTSKRWRRHS